MPDYLILDELRVRQVLINLLGNSIKFTNKGVIELLINKVISNRKKEMVRFTVRDSGVGISTSNLKRIFQAFSQEDNSITRKYGGTGLGLTISNKILQLMNSKLTVKSVVGEGSTFSFDLECIEGNEPQIITNDINKSEDSVSNSENLQFPYVNKNIAQVSKVKTGKPLKILIAEDNDTNRYLMKVILLNLYPEATILEAKNGNETVEIYNSENPDAVLMDVQMPLKSGFEATIDIRRSESGKTVPIIACTAGALIGEREKCLAAGMNDYISKPIVKERVKRVMEQWVRGTTDVGVSASGDDGISLSDNHYNKQELRDRYGEVLDVLEDLLVITKISLNEAMETFENIQKLPEKKYDFEQIKNAAHKLKGTALSMSFEKLASYAIELEVTPPTNTKRAMELMQLLIDEINYLVENIHEL